ncbi:MAG: AI-2E family transporter [Rikenellaceae bacterium]
MESLHNHSGFSSESVIRFLIVVACVATVGFLLWYFSDVVIYILVSALLAIMFRPLVAILSGLRVGSFVTSRTLAATLTLFIIWALFAALCSALLPLIFAKVYQLESIDMSSVFTTIEEPILSIQHYIQQLFSMPESNFSLNEALVSWSVDLIDVKRVNTLITSVIGGAAWFVISFFSISFITFFFLKDENLFFSMVSSLFPSRYEESVDRALSSITYLLSRYFVGLICESAIVATSVSVAMISFGMKTSDALFMGVVMGVLNVIPYAGPFLGACCSVFLGIVTPIEGLGLINTVLAILFSLAVIKGLDDFLVQPTLYSERVKAHPLEVFIVILMSGYVAGVVGMLLAIPSYTVLRVFAKEFFSQFSLVRKLTKEL